MTARQKPALHTGTKLLQRHFRTIAKAHSVVMWILEQPIYPWVSKHEERHFRLRRKQRMFSKLITVEPLDFAEPLEADPFEGTEGPDEEPNQTLRARDGASFSGIISQISQEHWRAYAWIRLESLQRTLEQRIGPRNFATLPLAHQWLRRAGGKRGFSSFEILVQPAGAQGVSKTIRVDGEAAVPILKGPPTSTLNEVPPPNDPGGPYRFGSGIVKAPIS